MREVEFKVPGCEIRFSIGSGGELDVERRGVEVAGQDDPKGGVGGSPVDPVMFEMEARRTGRFFGTQDGGPGFG